MENSASGGLLEFLLHDLVPGLSPEQVFAGFLEKDEGPTSYRNTIVCELYGKIIGMAQSYPSTYHVIDDEMRAFIPADRLKYIEELFDKNVEGTLFLDALCVEEQYRRRGIGTKLLDMMKERAKRQGFCGVSLDAHADNIGAIRLYERNGFKVVRRIEMSGNEYVPHDGGVYLMLYKM